MNYVIAICQVIGIGIVAFVGGAIVTAVMNLLGFGGNPLDSISPLE